MTSTWINVLTWYRSLGTQKWHVLILKSRLKRVCCFSELYPEALVLLSLGRENCGEIMSNKLDTPCGSRGRWRILFQGRWRILFQDRSRILSVVVKALTSYTEKQCHGSYYSIIQMQTQKNGLRQIGRHATI